MRRPTRTEMIVLKAVEARAGYEVDRRHPRAFAACFAVGWITFNPSEEEWPDAVLLTDDGRRTLKPRSLPK